MPAFDSASISILLQSLAVAGVLVIVVAVWRWVRVAIDRAGAAAETDAMQQLAFYVSMFVAAAEQQMANVPGSVRLDWVLAEVRKYLPGTDDALIRSCVEAAVLRLPRKFPPPAAPATVPPTPANCDDLAPIPPAETSHSHKERGRAKVARTG